MTMELGAGAPNVLTNGVSTNQNGVGQPHIYRIGKEYTGSDAHYADILVFEQRLRERYSELQTTQRYYRATVYSLLLIIGLLVWSLFFRSSEGNTSSVSFISFLYLVLFVSCFFFIVFVTVGVQGDRIYGADRFGPRIQRALRHFSMTFSPQNSGHLNLVARKLPKRFVEDFYRYRGRVEHAVAVAESSSSLLTMPSTDHEE